MDGPEDSSGNALISIRLKVIQQIDGLQEVSRLVYPLFTHRMSHPQTTENDKGPHRPRIGQYEPLLSDRHGPNRCLRTGRPVSPSTIYAVTRSNHFTMPSITPIEMRHTMRNTLQHCHNGILLYINGPIQISRLPTAVAPSHNPGQQRCGGLGGFLETKRSPSGKMKRAATGRKN